jgi:hypothetical protein
MSGIQALRDRQVWQERIEHLADKVETLHAAKVRALELAEYIDDKARALDDFGDLIAIPSQAWCELLAVLTRRADSGRNLEPEGSA